MNEFNEWLVCHDYELAFNCHLGTHYCWIHCLGLVWSGIVKFQGAIATVSLKEWTVDYYSGQCMRRSADTNWEEQDNGFTFSLHGPTYF